MSILSHQALLAELKNGSIKIEPELSLDQVKEASIDFRLGNTFRVYEKSDNPISICENTNYHNYTKEIKAEKLFLKPKETVLGITIEKITLPDNICAWIEGRSRFARLGLLIHISAGLIQPGVDNHQVLEITNLSPNTLELIAGERICQVVFEKLIGKALYRGKFSRQIDP
jgi:dCTP deaminase